MESRPLRVALVSPSALTRAGLRVLLGEDFAVTLETADLRIASRSDAELIVLDEAGLIETNLELHAVLLVSSDLEAVKRLRSLGPRSWGTVALEGEAPSLRAAARAVMHGLIVLPDSRLLEPLRRADDSGTLELESLTNRELEVLHALVEGLPNKRIAAELHVAESTVKYHLEGIYGKLGVRSRSQAVRAALQRGLVML